MLIFWLIVAWMVDRTLLKMAHKSYDAQYQAGYGSINAVLNREAPNPVRYRVLLPLIIGGVERCIPSLKNQRLPALYEPLRICLLGMAFYISSTVPQIGVVGALSVAVMLTLTYLFDYWDFAAELLAFALALTGNMQATIIGTGIAGLSRRETALLVPITYLLITDDWSGAGLALLAGLSAIGAVRLWQGYSPLYCKRIMWRQNLKDVIRLFENRPFYFGEIFIALCLTIATLIAAWRGYPAGIIAGVLLAIGWVFGRAAEVRIFTPCLLWVGMLICSLVK